MTSHNHKTTFDPLDPSKAQRLVVTGLYRFTRNPMYLGMTLVLLGTAITVGAFSSLFVPPVFMAVIEYRFIRPEEAMLREQFGEQFDSYCRNVRRWI